MQRVTCPACRSSYYVEEGAQEGRACSCGASVQVPGSPVAQEPRAPRTVGVPAPSDAAPPEARPPQRPTHARARAEFKQQWKGALIAVFLSAVLAAIAVSLLGVIPSQTFNALLVAINLVGLYALVVGSLANTHYFVALRGEASWGATVAIGVVSFLCTLAPIIGLVLLFLPASDASAPPGPQDHPSPGTE